MNTEQRSHLEICYQRFARKTRYVTDGKWFPVDNTTVLLALALSACIMTVCRAEQPTNPSRVNFANGASSSTQEKSSSTKPGSDSPKPASTVDPEASLPATTPFVFQVSTADSSSTDLSGETSAAGNLIDGLVNSPAFPLPKLQAMLMAAAVTPSSSPKILRLEDISAAHLDTTAKVELELDLAAQQTEYEDSEVMRALAERNTGLRDSQVSAASGKVLEESPSDLPANTSDGHPLAASQLASDLKAFSASVVAGTQRGPQSHHAQDVTQLDAEALAEFGLPPRIAAPTPEQKRAELSVDKKPNPPVFVAEVPEPEMATSEVPTNQVSTDQVSTNQDSTDELSAHDVVPMHTSAYADTVPFATSFRCGVMCTGCESCQQGRTKWRDTTTIPWEVFAQGEYVGPHRAPHVVEYRLRVDDRIDFMFRLTAEASEKQYEFNVGDQLRIESLTQPELDREVTIQPDGYITVRLLGQIRAAGKSVEAVTNDLEQQYKDLVKEPAITITPLLMNSRLTELRNTVDSRYGAGGQTISARVTPEGTVQLPGIGSVLVQGLTLSEAGQEVNARYRRLVKGGLDITPVLSARAPRFAFVLGEVGRPGRIELEGPTTVIQAIAMAGSWTTGADLHHVIVLRRDSNWELMATQIDLRKPLYARDACPDDLWLRDSDIVLLPKNKLQITNEIIDKVFTRGVYSVFPTSFPYQLRQLTTIR